MAHAADTHLREDIGFLKEGNLEDFAVLNRDSFTIPVDDIPSIKVLLTVLGGKVSYRDPTLGFEGEFDCVGSPRCRAATDGLVVGIPDTFQA